MRAYIWRTFVLAVIGWTLILAPLALGGYAFVLYPALVWLWSRLRPVYRPSAAPQSDEA